MRTERLQRTEIKQCAIIIQTASSGKHILAKDKRTLHRNWMFCRTELTYSRLLKTVILYKLTLATKPNAMRNE